MRWYEMPMYLPKPANYLFTCLKQKQSGKHNVWWFQHSHSNRSSFRPRSPKNIDEFFPDSGFRRYFPKIFPSENRICQILPWWILIGMKKPKASNFGWISIHSSDPMRSHFLIISQSFPNHFPWNPIKIPLFFLLKSPIRNPTLVN